MTPQESLADEPRVKSYRWRFQFGLRTLLILVTLAGIVTAAVSWDIRERKRLVDQRNQSQERAEEIFDYSQRLARALDEVCRANHVPVPDVPPILPPIPRRESKSRQRAKESFRP